MSNFDTKRKELLKKKNDFAIKSMEMNESIESFDQKRTDVEKGISRIPTDLPEEVQKQIDAAVKDARSKLSNESKDLERKSNELSKEADDAMDLADDLASELTDKSKKMAKLSGIPLIGAFSETKSEQLADQAEQMLDIRKETQDFQDKLAHQRVKLTRK